MKIDMFRRITSQSAETIDLMQLFIAVESRPGSLSAAPPAP